MKTRSTPNVAIASIVIAVLVSTISCVPSDDSPRASLDTVATVPFEAKGVFSQQIIETAKAGDPVSMRLLGAYYESRGSELADLDQALAWYRKAADAGDAIAMSKIGAIYLRDGVRHDDAEAVRWFRRAAESGDAVSMRIIGLLHSDGKAVGRNLPEAVRWYRLSADAGDAMAMLHLSQAYEKGEGTVMDKVEADRWMRRAAEAGNSLAKQRLMVSQGQPLPKSSAPRR